MSLKWAKSEIAKEMQILVPLLACRLDIARIRRRFEDLAFKSLCPVEYKEIARLLGEKLSDKEAYINRLVEIIGREIERYGIQAHVHGRPKHIYSIYQKIQQKGTPFEEIFDLIAIRVLVQTTPDCHKILGILHNKWNHIPERLRDFIGLPKANGYQSLHTTIRNDERPVEIQIRTFEMHQAAECGMAAYSGYKERISQDG